MTDKVDVSFLEKSGLSNWRGADELVLELAKTYKEEDAELSTLLTLSDATNYINKNMQLAASAKKDEKNTILDKSMQLITVAKQHDVNAPHWWLFKTANDYIKVRSNLMLQSISIPNESLKEYLKYYDENFLSDRDVQDVALLVTLSGGNVAGNNDILTLFDVAESAGSTDAEREIATQALVEMLDDDPNTTIDYWFAGASEIKMVDALKYIVKEARKRRKADNIDKAVLENFDLRLKADATDDVRFAIAKIAKLVPTIEAHNLLKELFEKESNGRILAYTANALVEQYKLMAAMHDNAALYGIREDIGRLLGEKASANGIGDDFGVDIGKEFTVAQTEIDHLSKASDTTTRQLITWEMGKNGGSVADAGLRNVTASDPNPYIKKLAENGRWWSALNYLPDSIERTAVATENITFKQMGEFVQDEKITFKEYSKKLDAFNPALHAYEIKLGLQRLAEKLGDPSIQQSLRAKGFGAQFKQLLEKRTGKWNETDARLQDRLNRLYKIQEGLQELKETKLYEFEPDAKKQKDAKWKIDNYETLLSSYDLLSVVGEDLDITKKGTWEPEKIYLSDVTTNLAKGVGLSPAEVTKMAFEALADPSWSFEGATKVLVARISAKKWTQAADFLGNLKEVGEKVAVIHKYINEHQTIFDFGLLPESFSKMGLSPENMIKEGLKHLSTYNGNTDSATDSLAEQVSTSFGFLREDVIVLKKLKTFIREKIAPLAISKARSYAITKRLIEMIEKRDKSLCGEIANLLDLQVQVEEFLIEELNADVVLEDKLNLDKVNTFLYTGELRDPEIDDQTIQNFLEQWNAGVIANDLSNGIVDEYYSLCDNKNKYATTLQELKSKVKEFLESLKIAQDLAQKLNISKNLSSKELIDAVESAKLLALSSGERSEGIYGMITIESAKLPKAGVSEARGGADVSVPGIVMNGLDFIDKSAEEFINARYAGEYTEYIPFWKGEGGKELFNYAASEFLASVKNIKELSDSIDQPKENWKDTSAWKTLFPLKFDSETSVRFLAQLFCETKMFYCDNGGENKSELVEAKIKEFLDAVQIAQEEDIDKKIDDYVNNTLNPIIGEYETLNKLAQDRNWDAIEASLAGSGLNKYQIEELMAVGAFEHDKSYINRLYTDIKGTKGGDGVGKTQGGVVPPKKGAMAEVEGDARKRRERIEKKEAVNETLAIFEKAEWKPEDLRRAKLLLAYIGDLIMEGLRDRDTALYQDLNAIKDLQQVLPIKFAEERSLLARMDRSFQMAKDYNDKFGERYHELDGLYKSFYNILRHCDPRVAAADAIEEELEAEGGAVFDTMAKRLAGWVKTGEGEYEESKWKQNNDPILKGKKYSKRDVVVELLNDIAYANIKALTSVPDVRDRILLASGEKIVFSRDSLSEVRMIRRLEEQMQEEASMGGVGGGVLAP